MSPIGITMGCPVGIGPEIVLKYFKDWKRFDSFEPVVIGDLGVLRHTAEHLGIDIPCISWHPGEPLPGEGVPVHSVSKLECGNLVWAKPTSETGQAMAAYIETAVKLCREGKLDGLVTCPISKSALQQSGYSYPGHTEMLADLTASKDFTMMMAGQRLRVVLVTIHCSLKNMLDRLSIDSICNRIGLTHASLKTDFDIAAPRIAVAGLNPHAGEEGLFGFVENEIIIPAVERSRNSGIDVTGPLPPDTVFLKAAQGDFDAVVCMYHDQGLIPFKLLHFSDGVNVTIGLSIVRTSVDHGTAYDIAGKGLADPESLRAAVKLAGEIAQNRHKHKHS